MTIAPCVGSAITFAPFGAPETVPEIDVDEAASACPGTASESAIRATSEKRGIGSMFGMARARPASDWTYVPQ